MPEDWPSVPGVPQGQTCFGSELLAVGGGKVGNVKSLIEWEELRHAGQGKLGTCIHKAALAIITDTGTQPRQQQKLAVPARSPSHAGDLGAIPRRTFSSLVVKQRYDQARSSPHSSFRGIRAVISRSVIKPQGPWTKLSLSTEWHADLSFC